MNTLQQLSRKHDFTDTESVLADYILRHVEDVCAMNIGTLAQVTHCSNASIVRLCRKLGLGGYRDLRIALARDLERLRTQMYDINPDRPFVAGSTTASIADSIAKLSKQAIDAAYATVSIQGINEAARLVLDARRIVYYAIGDTALTMDAFAGLLQKLGLVCTYGFSKGDYAELARSLDARDLAIIVTHSGKTMDDYERLFELLRSRGCRTLLLTSDLSFKERLVGSSCVIVLPEGETRAGRLATFYSQECIRFVLNLIYAEAFSTNYQQNVDNWQSVTRYFEGE